jgi:signal transduction histidine kinase
VPSASPPGSARADVDSSRLEQLVGVRSSKASYYAQWQGTRRDLERALAALRALSEALCDTALGPAALCRGVLDALGLLFDAEWAAVVLVDRELAATVPSHVRWQRAADGSARAPSVEQLNTLAAQAGGETAALTAGWPRDDGPGSVLAVPMRLDLRQVGTLLVGIARPGARDRIGTSILETVANQIVVALRSAWLYARSEELRRRAVADWAEAERRADELARRNQQLRDARARLARARQAELVSTERHRIARELHDGVAQCLVGVGMHLEWCHRHQDPGTATYDRVVASKELCRSALEHIRAAVLELSQLERPGIGLGEALRDLAADLRAVGSLQVSVRVHGQPRQLPLEIEHSLFQISQESLWNVVRHARASRAWLVLRYGDAEVALTVADDGRGDPAAIGRYLRATGPSRRRQGLRNIFERSAELRGSVAAERRKGGGVRIRVRLPDPAAAAVPDHGSGLAAVRASAG